MCPCDQSLVTVALLWEKLSQPQFCKDLTRKTAFFEGWSWFKFSNLGVALGTSLKFYTSVAKGLNLKVKKFCGVIPMFVEVTEEKLVGEPACPPLPPSWIGLRYWEESKFPKIDDYDDNGHIEQVRETIVNRKLFIFSDINCLY